MFLYILYLNLTKTIVLVNAKVKLLKISRDKRDQKYFFVL